MKGKQPYKSKTILFNTLILITSLSVVLLEDPTIKTFIGDKAPLIIAVVAIVNNYLRSITKEPIKFDPVE